MKCATLTFLDSFYATIPGRILASEVARAVKSSIVAADDSLLSIGFHGEYLDKLDNGKLFHAIPSSQPIAHWPEIRPFRTVIIDETAMPFLPNTWDTVIVIHFMEFFGKNSNFLREISRILKTNGRLIIIIVNKNRETTLPQLQKKHFRKKNIKYAPGEIMKLLHNSQFQIIKTIGLDKRFKFWPYSFSYNFDQYEDSLMAFLPILSDVAIIVSQKTELAAETIEALDPQYES
jgi:SAM-dependent methyltransferase